MFYNRFGYELIKSNEKWFRYDLVWEKSTPVGFLNAKKMPMRKHEMIYVFYENLPLYDISSHNHKLVKVHEPSTSGVDHPYGNTNGGDTKYIRPTTSYINTTI